MLGGVAVGDTQDIGLQGLEAHQTATGALMWGQAS